MIDAAESPYRRAIDTVEKSYEFMLAYAAQGRADDVGPGAPPVRDHLRALRDALEELLAGRIAREAAEVAADAERVSNFLRVLKADVRAAVAKIDLVLAAPFIGSQLVDNLNASIHVRATLTDVFLIDEFVKTTRRGATPASSS